MAANLAALCELAKNQGKMRSKDAKKVERLAMAAMHLWSGKARQESHSGGEAQQKPTHFALQGSETIMGGKFRDAKGMLNKEYRGILGKLGLKNTMENARTLREFEKSLAAINCGCGISGMLEFGYYNGKIRSPGDLGFFCSIIPKLGLGGPIKHDGIMENAIMASPWKLAEGEITRFCEIAGSSGKSRARDKIIGKMLESDAGQTGRNISLLASSAVENKYCADALFGLVESYCSRNNPDDEALLEKMLKEISRLGLLSAGGAGGHAFDKLAAHRHANAFFNALAARPFILNDGEIGKALADASWEEQAYLDAIVRKTCENWAGMEMLRNAPKSRFVLDAVPGIWSGMLYYDREKLIGSGFLSESGDALVQGKLASALETDKELWLGLLHEYARPISESSVLSSGLSRKGFSGRLNSAFKRNPCFKVLAQEADLKKFWRAGWNYLHDDNALQDQALQKNMGMILSVEGKRPGFFHAMYAQSGITHFERHSEEFWLAQYDSIGKRSRKPLLVLLEADADHSCAFQNLGELAEHLSEQFEIRVYGAATNREAAMRLVSAHRDYGKIDVMFMAMHGDNGAMQLGTLSYKGTLTADAILGLGGQRAGKNGKAKQTVGLMGMFSEFPTFLFISCSTGAPGEGAIAWRISERHPNADFYAPETKSGTSTIVYRGIKDGHHSFSVNWGEGVKGAKYSKGKYVKAEEEKKELVGAE